MYRTTTLGEWTRREAVLVSALATGAATATLSVPLDLPWLAVAGLVVAALGAVARLVIALRRAGLEREREQTASARRLRVAIAPIAQIDPTLIGVDRAEQQILPGEGRPAYVKRTADRDLIAAVTDAVDGSGPWMVVVHGPSKSGKSRSLFEALRVCSRTTAVELVAPVDAAALKSLLTPGEEPRLGACAAVLWLDDLEPLLNDGVTWQMLREWHTGGARRIVAATYGGKGSELIKGSRTGGLATITSEVLAHAREVALQATTPGELTELCRRVDPGEAASLERHGLAAYLVAGPALERKLSTGRHAPGDDACSEGVGIVRAAVDWARCGRTDAIADDTLRQLWPNYLPPGAPHADDDFARALSWALAPVAGSIALLSRTTSYRAFDYVVRLVADKRDALPVREDAWHAAIDSAADGKALAIATSAYKARRNDRALEALARASTSTSHEVAIVAELNRGIVLRELDRLDESIDALDALVARFGNDPDPKVRDYVVSALINKCVALEQLGQSEHELDVYDDIIARFGEAAEPDLRRQSATALAKKGELLGNLERTEESIVVYNDVVARYGNASDPGLREPVATALFNKGVELGQRGRFEDEIAVYDDIVTRYGDDRVPKLRELVGHALLNKASTLVTHDRCEDAITAYDDVVIRYGDDLALTLREHVANALLNKGVTFGDLDRSQDELGAYELLVARFGDAHEPTLQEIVAKALVNMGVELQALGTFADAVAVFDDVVARYAGAESESLDTQVAKALAGKGVSLCDLGRFEEAIGVFDDVVTGFGESRDPEARQAVAAALFNEGVALGQLGQSERQLPVYDEVLARFGDSEERALRDIVDRARDARSRADL